MRANEGGNETNLLNPLIPEVHLKILKNSIPTSNKTQRFSITKINWLKSNKERIAIYSENNI
jgi:hypothetical protein